MLIFYELELSPWLFNKRVRPSVPTNVIFPKHRISEVFEFQLWGLPNGSLNILFWFFIFTFPPNLTLWKRFPNTIEKVFSFCSSGVKIQKFLSFLGPTAEKFHFSQDFDSLMQQLKPILHSNLVTRYREWMSQCCQIYYVLCICGYSFCQFGKSILLITCLL